MSRTELELHRQRQQVTFEERLRKEKLKATRQEAEVQGEHTDRAAAAAEGAAEEARRQVAKAEDLRLSLERQQQLMGMRARRLEAEEVWDDDGPTRSDSTWPHLTSSHLTLSRLTSPHRT
jgi:hypothetical protein